METLPAWLQWAVALATVLSSVGVIVALIQLKISGNQFNKQLKLTEQQFKLTNQGYLQPEIVPNFFTSQDICAQQQEFMNPETLYLYILPVLNLQNVGNLPITYKIKEFVGYFNGKDVYQCPPAILNQPNILYPKQNLPTMLGRMFFGPENTILNFQQIQDLHLTFKLIVEYSDYNDSSGGIKTVDRVAALSGIILISQAINDKLPVAGAIKT